MDLKYLLHEANNVLTRDEILFVYIKSLKGKNRMELFNSGQNLSFHFDPLLFSGCALEESV
jgi:hypothetical protein